jgi:hypothetical protein
VATYWTPRVQRNTYLDAAEARVACELGLDAGAGGGEVHGRGDPDHDDDVEVLHEPGGGAHGLPLLLPPGALARQPDPDPSAVGGRAIAPGRVHRELPLPQGACRRVHPVVVFWSSAGVVCTALLVLFCMDFVPTRDGQWIYKEVDLIRI